MTPLLLVTFLLYVREVPPSNLSSSTRIIATMLHAHLHFTVNRTNGRGLGNVHVKWNSFESRRISGNKIAFTFLFSEWFTSRHTETRFNIDSRNTI
jgi:hypothetical protein